ncbi:MAG: hypothetical protein LM562_06890 [Pyrobaculum sp.]|nr:hypothetical protein [Pyrobaculum sp.]
MSTGMAVALFLLGLFLVFMAFLAAFVVTVVLGYIMAAAALAVGIYMAVKRGGRILPLVLGIVLAVFSLAVLAVVVAAQIEPVEIKYIKYGEVTTARLRA